MAAGSGSLPTPPGGRSTRDGSSGASSPAHSPTRRPCSDLGSARQRAERRIPSSSDATGERSRRPDRIGFPVSQSARALDRPAGRYLPACPRLMNVTWRARLPARGRAGRACPACRRPPGPANDCAPNTPWWSTRLMRGRGVSTASRPSSSTGSNRRTVVPSLHSVFRSATPGRRRCASADPARSAPGAGSGQPVRAPGQPRT
jgi:hypothetical protein